MRCCVEYLEVIIAVNLLSLVALHTLVNSGDFHIINHNGAVIRVLGEEG